MQRSNNTGTAFADVKHTPINWLKYLLVIVGIFAFFPLYRYILNQLSKNQTAEIKAVKQQKFLSNSDPLTQQTNADKITKDKGVQSSCKQLVTALGTLSCDNPLADYWSFLYPSGWTENDAEAARILIYQRNNYQLMKRLYNECYTNSRDLSKDALNLLDTSELKKVLKYIKL